jgi:hypothetical protein
MWMRTGVVLICIPLSLGIDPTSNIGNHEQIKHKGVRTNGAVSLNLHIARDAGKMHCPNLGNLIVI